MGASVCARKENKDKIEKSDVKSIKQKAWLKMKLQEKNVLHLVGVEIKTRKVERCFV